MSEPKQDKTLHLGAEHDQELRRRLEQALKDLGGRIKSSTWGVGGSQEVEQLEVEFDGRAVIVEAETYVGITVQGDDELITAIADAVREAAG